MLSRDIAKKFYNSKKWIRTKEEKLKKERYLCEECLKEGIIQRAENVHHKIELNAENVDDPKIALNIDNLECLCIHHHNVRHNRIRTRRYQINEKGEVVWQV